MKKRYIPLSFAALFALTISAQGLFQITPELQKLNMAVSAVRNLYVDTISESKAVEDAIVGMLEKLDPHSSYIPADEVEKASEPLDGNFEGIGVQFNMLEDTLLVVQTISGGPSERVGIVAGDRIVLVENESIAGVKMKNSDIMKRLRGKKGTEVNVKVLRRGIAEPLEFKIVRDKIPIYSLDAAYMADKETGYIKLNRFAATTHKEFLEAFEKLKKQGMKNLILDLQGNGGGYLNAATALADEFLADGMLIVYTEGSHSRRSVTEATAAGGFEKNRLVVLVDESSASASEIVSGAIQDWDRGLIVGRRTFGKGLVQRPVPLLDGSQIRLTTARYYTPSGRSIQRPYESGKKQYDRDIIDRYEHGELQNRDSISFPDSLKYQTKKLKRTVYGGGGIMPDIFIPLDTAQTSAYQRKLISKGVLNKTVMQYVDTHREELNRQYPDFEAYDRLYSVDETFLAELKSNAEKEKIEWNEEQYNRSLPIIKAQMKALVARDLFGIEEYFRVINNLNDSYKKALEVLRTPKLYKHYLN